MSRHEGAVNDRRRRSGGFDLLLGALVASLAAFVEPSHGSRVAVALCAAAVLLWPASPAAGSERRRTRVIILLALSSLLLASGAQTAAFTTSWKVRVWNVYHYYLGAKYFRELGYTGLYDATLRADREGRNYWRDIDRVRNLSTYEVEERRLGQRRFDRRESFEPQRWDAFKRDVEALSTQRSARSWSGIFVDRGYNATPVWTVVGGLLSRILPADRPLALKALSSLDALLLAATFGLVFSVFGLRRASLVLLLLTLSPVNLNRFVGGFLQYDWFCAVVASLCFYRTRRPVTAAGLMAYGVMTRVFPVFFLAAGLVPLVLSWPPRRRLPPRVLRYLIAFAVWCALAFALSLFNGRGVDGWREFAQNLDTHKEHHLYGERRVGLQFLFTHPLQELDLDESVAERGDAYERQKPLYAASAVILFTGFLWVARRQRTWDAQLLGLIPIFALAVSSRYYWSFLALVPLVGSERGRHAFRSRWLGGWQLLLFAAYYFYDALHGDRYAAYVVFNLLVLAYLVLVLVSVAGRASGRARAGAVGAKPSSL